MKTYTNKELARDYFKLVSRQISEISDSRSYYLARNSFLRIKKTLETHEIDIPSLYEESGKLDSLQGKKVFGEKTKKTLELILEKGVEEAIKQLDEEKYSKIKRGYKGRPQGNDQDPSFENVERAYEGD